MGLAIATHPVAIDGGVTYNILAGYAPIEVIFTRIDDTFGSIGDNGGYVQFTIPGNYTDEMPVGNYIHIAADGATYTYDVVAKITESTFSSPNTLITIDFPFVEVTGNGYVNWKQNYHVIMQLIDPVTGLDILGFNLEFNGTPNGVIVADISIPNDKNTQEILTASGALENGRVKYKFKYKEYWTDGGEALSYTTNSTEIIAVFANETPEIEEVYSSFDIPELYAGYPFFVNAFHSDSNEVGDVPQVKYRQLDINQDELVAYKNLFIFNDDDYGLLLSIFNTDDITLNANTKYIEFDLDFVTPVFFDSAFFDSAFFDA